MRRKTFIGGTLMAMLLGLATLFTAPVASAAPATSGKYCLTEVAPVAPGSRDLKTVSQTCSNTAKAGTVMPDTVSVAAAFQLLVVFHQNINYSGAYDTVGGNFGPCDASGYGFSNLSNVEFNVNGITSYEFSSGSNCHVADYWTGTSYTGTGRFSVRGNNPYVGSPWNDDIFSMKVRA